MSGHGNQDADYLNGRTSTSTLPSGQVLRLEDLQRLADQLDAMPKRPWTLMAPDGRVWQDPDPEALLRALAREVYAVKPLFPLPPPIAGLASPQTMRLEAELFSAEAKAAYGVPPSDGGQKS